MVVRIPCGRVFAGVVLVLLSAAIPRSAVAEFYKWTDEKGQSRISNIPPQGVRDDGTVVDTYHPNSIVAQHARMLEHLKEQAMTIEHGEAEAANKPGGGFSPFSLDILDGFGK
jgi:hypothetical protein